MAVGSACKQSAGGLGAGGGDGGMLLLLPMVVVMMMMMMMMMKHWVLYIPWSSTARATCDAQLLLQWNTRSATQL